MSRTQRIVPLLTLGVMALAGCRDDLPAPTEPGPGSAPEAKPVASESQDQSTMFRPHEEQFHKLSQEVKGFAGYHYDEQGNMIAYLVDPAEESRARELLDPIVRSRDLGQRERNTGLIQFRRAAYPFLELSAWRDRATMPVLEIRGVEWTDLDEAQNRFVVGLSDPAAREQVLKVLAEQRVPAEAVLFEESGRAVQDLTLQDYQRPIEGGYQIQRAGGGSCTLGFNAFRSGKASFLTNSHCTSSVWQNTASSIYQNVNSNPANFVGTESHDPSPWYCAPFGILRCRWSDAAVIGKASGVQWNYGKIARTTFWGSPGNSGSITVDPKNPRMTIIGEYSFPTGGEMFDKVGRTTGWTYGFVKKTCVDMIKSSWSGGGIGVILCQDWANYKRAGGDSGSPVFRWYGSTVRLAGIHWGGITQGGKTYGILSAMWNIEHDLGALSTH